MANSSPKIKTAKPPIARVQILETTDLHMQLLPFDYFTGRAVEGTGLIALASTIDTLRNAPDTTTFLFDNGDFLQGNPLADFAASQVPATSPHPMINAMNMLRYDAVALGNHEFNYGLEFLQSTLQDAQFEVVCANLHLRDDQTIAPAYTILEREIMCDDGRTRPLRVGVLGIVTPQVVIWDKSVLDNAVVADDIVQTAQRLVPQMRAAGADIIVALCHAGIDPAPWTKGMENAAFHLAGVDGVDVVLTGHTHDLFPDGTVRGEARIDSILGSMQGTPAVMAGAYGSHLGFVSLTLAWEQTGWEISTAKVALHKAERPTQNSPLQAKMSAAVQDIHAQTMAHIQRPIAKTTVPLNSHFALAAPDMTLELLARAQQSAVAQIAQEQEWADLPILSAVAPFRAGGKGGPTHFIDIPPGALTLRDVAAIYPFANRVVGLRRTGAQVRDWLDRSARVFNTLTQGASDQELLRHRAAPYNFDVIYGLTYQIDLLRPDCRIDHLEYDGQPVEDDDIFIVATNSYRADGGGDLVIADPADRVCSTMVGAREELTAMLSRQKVVAARPTQVWRFAPVPDTQAIIRSAPTAVAPHGPHHLVDTGSQSDGFSVFALHL